MPTSFRIDIARAIVFAETRGETSSHDILQNLASLLDHPSYSPGMRLLLDMRDVVPSLLRSDVLTIARFVREHAEKIGTLKMAVVVPRDASFGMAQEQKVEVEDSPIDMEVFRGLGEAREWLGLLRDEAPKLDSDAAAG